jgi:cell division protease FtsH
MKLSPKFSIPHLVFVVVLIMVLQATFFGGHTETLPYSDFKKLVQAGKVTDLVIEDTKISGDILLEGVEAFFPKERVAGWSKATGKTHPFTTTRVTDPGLVTELEAAKIAFAGRVANTWMSILLSWILPFFLLFGLPSLLMGRGMGGMHGGLMNIGKSKAKVYVEKSTGVTFEDVAGIDEARAELMEIVHFLKKPDWYRRLGGKIPKGVLLVRLPGTGKTLLAKAVAGEAKVPFFSLSGSEFVEMFVGIGAARVRDLFAQAQEHAPSIIFIDELDALGQARGANPMLGGHDEREQTLNQLLAEMDGFNTDKGVIILAATNRPEILDPALMRPGRFDRKIAIDRPDLQGREKILRVHTRGVKLSPAVDLTVVAARTPGFVGADLANLVNEAALGAARNNKDAVEMVDFEEALDRVIGGIERKSKVINPREKQIVANHEAGHAIIAECRPSADRVAKISIIPRGVAALGYTQQQPTDDRYLLTRSELLDRLDVLLGGRVAEEIVFGDVSTGAQDDLQRATDTARHMVTQYGMSETLGLATFEEARFAYLQVRSMEPKDYSEETSRMIDAEIRKLLSESHARVHETLLSRRDALDALAKMLCEREVVDRSALESIIGGPLQPSK